MFVYQLLIARPASIRLCAGRALFVGSFSSQSAARAARCASVACSILTCADDCILIGYCCDLLHVAAPAKRCALWHEGSEVVSNFGHLALLAQCQHGWHTEYLNCGVACCHAYSSCAAMLASVGACKPCTVIRFAHSVYLRSWQLSEESLTL